MIGLSLAVFGQTEKVVFSAPGGFYDSVFSLSLECLSDLHHVRYTTNGSTPNAKSFLYEHPLLLNDSLYSHSDIYTILTSPPDLFYLPDSVQHCIVIRAAVFDENDSCISKTTTHSYLIRDLENFDTQLPMLSLSADSLALFDFETGILVPGALWDSTSPHNTGNYYQHGREWERLANVEFYEPDDNSGINQGCGLRTHGAISRIYSAKGLKIYAREEYGKKRFVHNFFDDTPIISFKRLVLKPFAVFWPNSGTNNYLSTQLALHLGIEGAHSRPVVVFLNGEYWGVYFLQEKTDERYLEDYFDINLNNCNIIENWYGKIDYGNNQNFLQMMDWLNNADLTDDDNYETLCQLIDLDNFIDYVILETYIGNYDWPGNNMRCWQTDDGPWRWIFFDGDYAFIREDFNAFDNLMYTGPQTGSNNTQATLMFRKLMTNPHFDERLNLRLNELCQGPLQYDSIIPSFRSITQTLEPEIARQTNRFGYPLSLNAWYYGNSIVDHFLQQRTMSYFDCYSSFIQTLHNEEFHAQQMACYPNPAKDVLFVETQNVASQPDPTYRIANHEGQTIMQGHITAEKQQINIESLPAGMYFITFAGETRKFMVR